ncbi:hypothetical protein KJZ71_00870 [Patescibacteria group bacterium]|uniref:Uncharacterized protein n=1 Tax=candidate division WWE3 bacterium TaxID=2053526 RepID=A0A928TVW7_UNCKA|nr:hypothetical protein [candidate division WWE3 bacterium]MCL4732340.1 hypothetical protein [Patescibacteria group bacterium]MDL1952765.1 hypothetical protein [Candidatus Uhrbacteria bacterium UHB]RIL01001.1 MAG: hypothetical protein DCC77_00460 [Candidatus Uhrbacteria bacterium]
MKPAITAGARECTKVRRFLQVRIARKKTPVPARNEFESFRRNAEGKTETVQLLAVNDDVDRIVGKNHSLLQQQCCFRTRRLRIGKKRKPVFFSLNGKRLDNDFQPAVRGICR